MASCSIFLTQRMECVPSSSESVIVNEDFHCCSRFEGFRSHLSITLGVMTGRLAVHYANLIH